MDKITESARIKTALQKITERVIREKTRPCLRLYKATVTSAPNTATNLCGVQLIGNTNTYNFPFSNVAADVKVGDIVWVASLYDSFSSAFVFATANFDVPTGSASDTDTITVYPGTCSSISPVVTTRAVDLLVSKNFTNSSGTIICVTFLSASVPANSSLNVNNTTAYPIFPASTTIQPTETVFFMFYNNQWRIVGNAGAVGISSITQTTESTADGGINVWTATLTDGTTSNFNVRNGNQGTSVTGASITLI